MNYVLFQKYKYIIKSVNSFSFELNEQIRQAIPAQSGHDLESNPDEYNPDLKRQIFR